MKYQARRADEYIKVLAWLFTLSFILITFLPRSIDDTMFMDGVTYASIARNMSIGAGSFWRPYFADSFWLPYDNNGFFSGHPPLQFGIQALMFRLLGDSTAVENSYDLIVLACSVALIIKIWRLLLRDKPGLRSYAWLPVLCWYTMVTVWYSIPNNFLDSTLAVFCLLSCYFQLLFFQKSSGSNKRYLLILLAGICIVLGFLTKGPVSFFPLAIPLIYTISMDRKLFRTAVRCIAAMVGIFLISFLIILSYQPAYDFMTTYFNGQVVQALLQKREKTGEGLAGHFYLLFELLRNSYPYLFGLAALHLILRMLKMPVTMSVEVKRACLFLLLITCSATLPMLISVKQYPHYLLPALPFTALLFAGLSVEKVAVLFSFDKKWLVIALVTGCICCWALTFSKIVHIKPNSLVANAMKIRQYVGRSATIGICPGLFHDADIHANLQRYDRLSLTTDIRTARYIFADSACLPQLNAGSDTIIPLQRDYLLVIRNAQVRGKENALKITSRGSLPDGL